VKATPSRRPFPKHTSPLSVSQNGMVDDVARRIRTAVASPPSDRLTDRLDITIGIAWTSQHCDVDLLLCEADREMYLVKQIHQRHQPRLTHRLPPSH